MKILSIILLSFTLLAGGLFAADVSWISQAQAGDDDHDEHEEEHEEGKTEIDAEAAKAAGVEISKAGAATVHEVLTLTGRIMLNRNTTTEVRARFPGVVKSVNVNWGDKVTYGQKLATV
ncbi:MAG: efflux RND transporter periplasmic adaptor subunit [Alphaproteobacteria bacterium]|nr:efflux RND transporter periplasmic adaptor subunit [Alphaproteobacteria bacterium]